MLLSEVACREGYGPETPEELSEYFTEHEGTPDMNWKEKYGLDCDYFPEGRSLNEEQKIMIIGALKQFFDAIMVQVCFEEDFCIRYRYGLMVEVFNIGAKLLPGFYTRFSCTTTTSDDFLSEDKCLNAVITENSKIIPEDILIQTAYFPNIKADYL